MLPYEKNNITNNTGSIYNPLTPLQGGNNAATPVKPEQFETLGEFKNVRLTESQRAALSEEFGADKVSALIEQLSAYIKSKVKRIPKKADHYALIKDWALRRIERKQSLSLSGMSSAEKRQYSEEELNAIFTPLDDEDN